MSKQELEPKLVPLFDHRIDELVELLKRVYEIEAGFIPFSWDWYSVTLKPNQELRLIEITGEGILYAFCLAITMPDSTVPDVGPIYEIDDAHGRKYRYEEWTIYELHSLGLRVPNNVIGFVTDYDTTNYIYRAIWTKKIHWYTSCYISLKNWTSKTVTCQIIGVETRLRPYARYVETLKR